MRKNNTGFLQVGIALLVASAVLAGFLVNKVKFNVSEAAAYGYSTTDTCGLIETTSSDNLACSLLNNNTGNNNVSAYSTTYTVKNVSSVERTVNITKRSDYCLEPYAQFSSVTNFFWCPDKNIDVADTVTLAGGQSVNITVTRASDSGLACGSYQTDLLINSVDGNTACHDATGGVAGWGICQTGTSCSTVIPTPTPKPTPTKTPHVTPTPVCTPTPTPKVTHTPHATYTPKPSHTPKPTKSPKPTPTMTPTGSPISTPTPNSKLRICKYDDKNGNGVIDNNEGTISWTYFYSYQDKNYQTGSRWWDVLNRGCRTVDVPSSQWIKVWEEGRADWNLTNIYSDGNIVGGTDFTYVSYPGNQKTVWFLNHHVVNKTPGPTPTLTPVPSGNPNSCNGTCGSNYNCQGGLFCYQGYCRNPICQSESSCGCPGATPTPVAPQVLAATAPPVLPKTGANPIALATGFVGLAGTGFWLFRKFRLV